MSHPSSTYQNLTIWFEVICAHLWSSHGSIHLVSVGSLSFHWSIKCVFRYFLAPSWRFLTFLFSGGHVSAFPTWTMSLSTEHLLFLDAPDRLHLRNMAALEVNGFFSQLHVSFFFQVFSSSFGSFFSPCFLWLFVNICKTQLLIFQNLWFFWSILSEAKEVPNSYGHFVNGFMPYPPALHNTSPDDAWTLLAFKFI